MFDFLSGETQLILIFVVLAILFPIVQANNKRNKDKRRGRSRRDFKKRIEERRKDSETSSE